MHEEESDRAFAEFDDREVVSPLSANELEPARIDLAQWRTPTAFQDTVYALLRRCRSVEFFNDPRHSFLRDAFVLAQFVRHKLVDQTRLSDAAEQWPDGFVRTGGKVKNIEVTIALTPGRKMGDEYKFTTESQLDHVHNWVERAAAIPGALTKAIRDKIAKQYGSRTCLVVYLNINEYGIRQAEIEAAIVAIKQSYATSFDGLFVLWKDKMF
jgi:hypothetical protein